MKKAFLTTFFILFILFLTVPFFYILSPTTSSQITDAPEDGIIYTLPYPGILPDHPAYFLKAARDKVTEFAIRDNTEKAKHYLMLSDKRAAMAMMLAKKGKNELAITTFSKGEKYSLKIPDLLKETKKQGGEYNAETVNTLKLSNLKHRELLDMLLRQMPQGEGRDLDLVIDLNSQVKDQLNTL